MKRYEILSVNDEIVSYQEASTAYQAALLYFKETGNLDGPWRVTNLSTEKTMVVEQQVVVALAYHQNNVGEPEEEWVLN